MFEELDDFNWVIEQNIRELDTNPKTALIQSIFGDKLIFGLFERATLANMSDIGNIYVYSHHSINAKEEIIKEYEKIINELQSEKQINPSKDEIWYKYQKSYIHIGQNDIPNHETETKRWHHSIGNQSDGKNEDKLFELEKTLSKEQITDYLNSYVEKLKQSNRLEFNKFPHYAIIIKPISVSNPHTGKIYPIGNLYLHLGTTEKLDKNFYSILINKLLLVWFRFEGNILIETIIENCEKTADKKEEHSLVPKLTPKQEQSNKWERAKYKDLKAEIEKLNNSDIESIAIATEEMYRFCRAQQITETKLKEWKIFRNPAINTRKKIDKEFVCSFLLGRRFLIILVMLLNKPILDVHGYLADGTPKNVDSTEKNSTKLYLLNNLLFGIRHFSDNREHIEVQFSKSEKEFYDKYKNNRLS